MLLSIPAIIFVCFVNPRLEGLATTASIKHASSHILMAKDPYSAINRRRRNCNDAPPTPSTKRRDFIIKPSISIIASIFAADPARTDAACLPGDIRSECIGIYKLPLDDAILSYVETPEQLKKYAPDLNWVSLFGLLLFQMCHHFLISSCTFICEKVPPIEYPSSYPAAINQIGQQGGKIDAAKEFILKGDLIQGGLVLLDVVPTISSAGKVILKCFNDALNKERNLEMKRARSNNDQEPKGSDKSTVIDMKAYRFEYAMNELLGLLGETDVLIGQGLRGELGVSAPAQIQILSSLDEARREFEEMMRVIPDKI